MALALPRRFLKSFTPSPSEKGFDSPVYGVCGVAGARLVRHKLQNCMDACAQDIQANVEVEGGVELHVAGGDRPFLGGKEAA